jgi:branched-chain amino acid transport system ATP-binding protein
MILSVADLDAFYGPFQALRGVSLRIETGAIHALLGRNGAGKTTTLRSIFGLLEQTSGRVDIDGTPLGGHAPHRISAMGVAFIPEQRGVFGGLTVRENLKLVEDRKGPWPMERVLELFPPLKTLLARRGSHLSGGEQQMLVIGRALMLSPKFLLLDEPSQGLAPVIVDTVVDTLLKLRGEAIGILLVEQNAALALEIADDATLLDQGEVRFSGRASSLLQNPGLLEASLGVG